MFSWRVFGFRLLLAMRWGIVSMIFWPVLGYVTRWSFIWPLEWWDPLGFFGGAVIAVLIFDYAEYAAKELKRLGW